jgi:hypothetical protein
MPAPSTTGDEKDGYPFVSRVHGSPMSPHQYVELDALPVLRVKADMRGSGPPAAFRLLESKLPTLRGRKFYGTFLNTPDGGEYHACVARVDSDDPAAMGLEAAVVAGGWFARRKLADWESHVNEILPTFQAMVREEDVDSTRHSREFYRSQRELQLLLPVKSRR